MNKFGIMGNAFTKILVELRLLCSHTIHGLHSHVRGLAHGLWPVQCPPDILTDEHTLDCRDETSSLDIHDKNKLLLIATTITASSTVLCALRPTVYVEIYSKIHCTLNFVDKGDNVLLNMVD